MRLFPFLPVLAIVAACTTDDGAATDTTRAAGDTGNVVVNDDVTRAAVDSLRNAWKAAADRKDAAAVRAMYADDAVMVGGQGPAARGLTEIERSVNGLIAAATIESIDSKEIAVGDDVAYDYGTYTMRLNAPNARPRTVTGHYVVTLRRQGDGTWKITKHLDVVPPAAR